jgi:hypothetical protein
MRHQESLKRREGEKEVFLLPHPLLLSFSPLNSRPRRRGFEVALVVWACVAGPGLAACGSSGAAGSGGDAAARGDGAAGAQGEDATTDSTASETGAAGDAAAPGPDGAGSAHPEAGADGSTPGADAGDAGGTPGARSGLPWMSGSNGDPTMEARYYDAFGTWRGRPDDVAMLYTDRSSWSSVTGANMFVFQYMTGWPGKLVISQPPFPSDGSTLAQCAAGAYDAHWQDFGNALVSNNRASSIIRIAWEFNGDFMYWHATNDTAQFIQCWNHVASAIKSTDPQALTDWTINSKYTPTDTCMGNATNCYPGDQYVDYIGIDNYDQWPPSTTTPFDTIANAVGGVTWIYDFAVQHHKRFSVGEWGVVSAASAGANAGGDNPAFVQNMWNWFQAHPAIGLYESYFSTSLAGEVDSKIIDNTTGTCGCDNPMASAKYHQLWHP